MTVRLRRNLLAVVSRYGKAAAGATRYAASIVSRWSGKETEVGRITTTVSYRYASRAALPRRVILVVIRALVANGPGLIAPESPQFNMMWYSIGMNLGTLDWDKPDTSFQLLGRVGSQKGVSLRHVGGKYRMTVVHGTANAIVLELDRPLDPNIRVAIRVDGVKGEVDATVNGVPMTVIQRVWDKPARLWLRYISGYSTETSGISGVLRELLVWKELVTPTYINWKLGQYNSGSIPD